MTKSETMRKSSLAPRKFLSTLTMRNERCSTQSMRQDDLKHYNLSDRRREMGLLFNGRECQDHGVPFPGLSLHYR